MAATRILLAALALPGLVQGENAPEQASISVRHLDYKDSQPNLERIHVRSPSFEIAVPVAGEWLLRGGAVVDAISGASPRYHTAISGASRFTERRKGADAGVTRYFRRATVTAAGGYSTEHDYVSRFVSVNASFSSEDNNTTWLFGTGVSNDRINPVNQAVVDAHKRVRDYMVGVTQVLTPADIVQLVFTHVRGRGYYDMPYKYLDQRPDRQEQNSALVRWNHHFKGSGVTTRASYRYYTDAWGISAHTLTADYVRPLAGGWTLTPSLRLHSQSAADFYVDPVYDSFFGPPFPPGFSFPYPRDISQDQRLSAYGAATLGLKVEKEIGANATVDIKWEQYKQRGEWRVFGAGSTGLQAFSARSIQAGVTYRW